MITIVTCIVPMLMANGDMKRIRMDAKLIDDSSELWQIDIGDELKRLKLQDQYIHVRYVNDNDCLYKTEKK